MPSPRRERARPWSTGGGQGPPRPAASCARCGAPLPPTKRGVPRRDARYCGTACRSASTREARAAAREDLTVALKLLSRALEDARATLCTAAPAAEEVAMSDVPEDLMPITAAARAAGVPERSLFRAVEKGRIPTHEARGRHARRPAGCPGVGERRAAAELAVVGARAALPAAPAGSACRAGSGWQSVRTGSLPRGRGARG